MGQLGRGARSLLLVVALSFAAGLAGCGHRASGAGRPRVIRIAIQPNYSLAVMSRKYRPLIEYLSQETGYRVEQVSSLSQTNYLSAIEGAQADIAFLNPLLYLQVVKTRGAYPLARVVNSDGSDRFRGVIITRADSNIRTLQDLRGSIAMTSSRRGVGGYLSQYKLLRDNGIDPDREMTIVVGRTQDEVARAVFQRKVKVGFVREDFASAVGSTIDARQIRIIAYTDYFPTWCFAAFKTTDPAAAEGIKRALLKLDGRNAKDRPILYQAQAARFIEASDADYEPVRKIIAELDLPY